MNIQLSLLVAALGLGIGGFAGAHPSSAATTTPDVRSEFVSLLPAGWQASDGTNICGISDLRKVSNPAVVDYPTLLDTTPQAKRMKKEKIDPDSRLGRLLRREASSLILKKCQVVRKQHGHCGIWKEISHSDGRTVPDVTSDVSSVIQSEE